MLFKILIQNSIWAHFRLRREHIHPGGVPGPRKGLEGCGAATAFGRYAAKRWGRSAKARTPAKPGFLRSKKCAQMKSLLYPFVFYKKKHYIFPVFSGICRIILLRLL
jgi:hypothetical protein